MRKTFTLGAAIVSVAFLSNAVYAARADLKTVGVGAIVSESASSMDVKVLDIVSGTEVAGIDFGSPLNSVSPWSTLAPHVVELKVVNANNWELKTYTDNFNAGVGVAPDPAKWGIQYGGLIDNANAGKKVGMGWAVKTSRVQAGAITTGSPVDGKINGFTFLKDKSDLDDPDLAESQAFDIASGYINIAFGGYETTNIVDPTVVDEEGGFVPTPLAENDAPFYYYVEGNFSGASAATYATTINFDLINL
jgi:hypothetical protein